MALSASFTYLRHGYNALCTDCLMCRGAWGREAHGIGKHKCEHFCGGPKIVVYFPTGPRHRCSKRGQRPGDNGSWPSVPLVHTLVQLPLFRAQSLPHCTHHFWCNHTALPLLHFGKAESTTDTAGFLAIIPSSAPSSPLDSLAPNIWTPLHMPTADYVGDRTLGAFCTSETLLGSRSRRAFQRQQMANSNNLSNNRLSTSYKRRHNNSRRVHALQCPPPTHPCQRNGKWPELDGIDAKCCLDKGVVTPHAVHGPRRIDPQRDYSSYSHGAFA